MTRVDLCSASNTLTIARSTASSRFHPAIYLFFFSSRHSPVLRPWLSFTSCGFATYAVSLSIFCMCGRGLCVVAGRLQHPPTLSRGLRSLTNCRPAANHCLTIGRSRRKISYGHPFASFPSTPMTTRRLHSTKATNGEKRHAADEVQDHEHTTTDNHTHDHDHDHEDHSHSHSHSHGIFGAFGHTHSREDGSTAGAEKIVEALKGGSTS